MVSLHGNAVAAAAMDRPARAGRVAAGALFRGGAACVERREAMAASNPMLRGGGGGPALLPGPPSRSPSPTSGSAFAHANLAPERRARAETRARLKYDLAFIKSGV